MSIKELLVSSIAIKDPGARAAFEATAFSKPALREHLSSNAYLSEAVWFKLYKRPRVSINDAVSLASRKLSSEQRLHLIANEKRERPLVSMLAHNLLSEFEQESLARSVSLGSRVGIKLLGQIKPSHASLVREVSLRIGGLSQLRWLATGLDVDEGSARELIKRFKEWGPEKSYLERSRLLGVLLERFPGLVDVYAASDQGEAALSVVAGSRHLKDPQLQRQVAGVGQNLTFSELEARRFVLISLVNNPVVGFEVLDEVKAMLESEVHSTGQQRPSQLTDALSAIGNRKDKGREGVSLSFDKVDDPEVLRWLFNRSIGSDFKPQGRPVDLAEVALNPALDESLRRRAAVFLSSFGSLELLGSAGPAFWDSLVKVDPKLIEFHPKDSGLFEALEDSGSPLLASPDYLFNPEAPMYSAAFSATPVTHFRYGGGYYLWLHMGQYLTDTLGERLDAWETFISLVDEFDGSLADLAAVSVQL